MKDNSSSLRGVVSCQEVWRVGMDIEIPAKKMVTLLLGEATEPKPKERRCDALQILI